MVSCSLGILILPNLTCEKACDLDVDCGANSASVSGTRGECGCTCEAGWTQESSVVLAVDGSIGIVFDGQGVVSQVTPGGTASLAGILPLCELKKIGYELYEPGTVDIPTALSNLVSGTIELYCPSGASTEVVLQSSTNDVSKLSFSYNQEGLVTQVDLAGRAGQEGVVANMCSIYSVDGSARTGSDDVNAMIQAASSNNAALHPYNIVLHCRYECGKKAECDPKDHILADCESKGGTIEGNQVDGCECKCYGRQCNQYAILKPYYLESMNVEACRGGEDVSWDECLNGAGGYVYAGKHDMVERPMGCYWYDGQLYWNSNDTGECYADQTDANNRQNAKAGITTKTDCTTDNADNVFVGAAYHEARPICKKVTEYDACLSGMDVDDCTCVDTDNGPCVVSACHLGFKPDHQDESKTGHCVRIDTYSYCNNCSSRTPSCREHFSAVKREQKQAECGLTRCVWCEEITTKETIYCPDTISADSTIKNHIAVMLSSESLREPDDYATATCIAGYSGEVRYRCLNGAWQYSSGSCETGEQYTICDNCASGTPSCAARYTAEKRWQRDSKTYCAGSDDTLYDDCVLCKEEVGQVLAARV